MPGPEYDLVVSAQTSRTEKRALFEGRRDHTHHSQEDSARGDPLRDSVTRREMRAFVGSNALLVGLPVGVVLEAVYFVFISRRFAGKVSVKRDTQGFY